jgi:hypothetical protein
MSELLSAINKFDESFAFSEYNMFNSSEVGALANAEVELEDALNESISSPAALSEARSRIDLNLAARLIAFSLRQSTMAVRSRDCKHIKAGTLSLILDDDLLDIRDVYLALAVLGDASVRIECPFDEIFRVAASLATSQRSAVITNGFLAGPNYVRSIRSMGVELRETNEGLVYVVNMF